MSDPSPRPHHGERFIQTLFDSVARRYDLLNGIISFHLDTRWRREAVRRCVRDADRFILDVGTGTGDLALEAARTLDRDDGRIIVGLDLSLEMLRHARAKNRGGRRPGTIFFVSGSALASPFADERFDVIMTAFVLRNLPDLSLFFREAFRLTRPGGTLVTLDMFPPAPSFFAHLYSFYFYRFVPRVGAAVAGQPVAYRYLSDSVRSFAQPETIAGLIAGAGFTNVTVRKFLRGAVCLHAAQKPPAPAPRS